MKVEELSSYEVIEKRWGIFFSLILLPAEFLPTRVIAFMLTP